MRLLAVGRSIRPVGHQPNRYRMTLGLPKLKRVAPAQRFRRDQEPARTTAPKGADSSKNTPHRMVALAPAKAGRTSVMIRLLRKILFGKDPKMNCSVEAGARSGSSETLAIPAQAYPLGRWTMFKNPFVKRSKATMPTAPVQGELLLDLVRPVRNDLSDTDLEVIAGSPIPASRGPVVPATPDAPAISGPATAVERDSAPSDPQPQPAAWSRVNDEFIEAGKS